MNVFFPGGCQYIRMMTYKQKKSSNETKASLHQNGVSAPLPPAPTAKGKQHCRALNLQESLVSRDFAVHLLLRRFGDGTESNLQLLHHSRETITYCSPMLENTIHRSSTAQWAKSERCFGTHRRLRLLRPQHWWVTPFI